MEPSSEVRICLTVPGFSLEYRGRASLYERDLLPLLSHAARSAGTAIAAAPTEVATEAAEKPGSPSSELPADHGLYAELGSRGTRSAERDAVLCALVDLAGPANRDVRAPEILALLTIRGFPGRPRVKPILSKLRDWHHHAESGVAPGTWRPAAAGLERVMGLRAIAAE